MPSELEFLERHLRSVRLIELKCLNILNSAEVKETNLWWHFEFGQVELQVNECLDLVCVREDQVQLDELARFFEYGEAFTDRGWRVAECLDHPVVETHGFLFSSHIPLQLADAIVLVASTRTLAWPVDMDCDSTKMRGVDGSDGVHKTAEEQPAEAACESELVLGIEDAAGLGVDGLTDTKERAEHLLQLQPLPPAVVADSPC
ncbi:hypothetical protein HII31_09208 [Pseudocercospora fuligena]|uniref:Uncharacterized protein n=1 Tax=Pseudocercospora fuligena TaxID=685502 RepID=A0A8H6VEN2_9PEZI|nr:hypothetical protein HII31_09208 [Pseudocercospora fuligena]